MTARRLRARWLFPMHGPPIPDGAVLIDAGGRVRAVGAHPDVPSPAGVLRTDLPEAALLPGLVNTHTHLELSDLEDAAPEEAFFDWILRLRSLKEARSDAESLGAARAGVLASWATGVTTIADTGDTGAAHRALSGLGGSGVCYLEAFGPDPAQAPEALSGLQARVAEARRICGAAGRVRIGVSPHAPYSVSGPLYRSMCDWARREGLPIAVHLAESHAETAHVVQGEGPFAEAWTRRGLPSLASHGAPDAARRSPVAWADAWSVLGASTLVIHAVQVDATDVAMLAERGAAVAHCPRANRRHLHGEAPLVALRRAGIRLGLGTDSAASVAPVDLWAEAAAARALGGLDALDTLRLLTIDGARALGMDGEVGQLAPGRWGDVAVVGLARPASDDPEAAAEDMLARGRAGMLATLVAGRLAAGALP